MYKFELQTNGASPIEFLRTQGILANAYFYSIEGSIIEHILTPAEIKKYNITKKLPTNIIDQLVRDEDRNARIFDSLVNLIEENKKILFFGTSIEHSKMITTLINLKGYTSVHVDGKSGKFRQEAIAKFKEGKIDVLCNYGVLSTGFDDPEIDVVFMARPTNSIVLYSQIIGRGLRGPLIGGTDSCEIYTVFDNIYDLPQNSDIYTYFDKYFVNQ